MDVTEKLGCRACGAAAAPGAPCAECGRLQPFHLAADHWTVLGLERRLALVRVDLERRFHDLNRRFHPDYFRLRSAAEQAVSLANSAAVNTAYRVLRDPVSRAEYLLERAGMALHGRQPPADLFEEILELQEARQELAGADPAQASGLREQLTVARDGLRERHTRTGADLVALFTRFDAAVDGERDALLRSMRDVLATRAYLRTVLRDLTATLGIAELEE
jgi:molecular chaperone HscB